MKADFSGYATKAGIKCSDGRTIMPDAFKHQDKLRVPLVWQHGHSDPENVLGHAILENRPDGVYTYGFFNTSPKGIVTKGLVEHGDIVSLSIWANQLIERAGRVIHGAIREVSLVLSGANPGAQIDNVTIHHSDADDETLEDEAIIFSGLDLEHTDETDGKVEEEVSQPGTESKEKVDASISHDSVNATPTDETLQDVYDTMTPKQKDVLHFMLGQALENAETTGGALANSEIQSNPNDKTAETGDKETEGNQMSHNVFEKGEKPATSSVLSHDDMKAIVTSAARVGSLKTAFQDYALAHGITDIDTLFPDAQSLDSIPEWNKRRTEWVSTFIGAARKSPFARIKTVTADLTMDEARAKGYVTGALKREEFFSVSKRITTPTTIYKKQALDRDDVIDITDFDVVAWLKGEMRLMLDEEIARAMLVGDGRDISSEDKINEQNIRPIATDHELYTSVVTVNVDDASSSMNEVLDAVILNRAKLKGTGVPTFYTTEYWIARFLLLRDGQGRRMYRNLTELALELRVDSIVPVEVLLETPDIIGIMVNPVDYVLGANKGGQVSMFDDFDIDYNKQKYLIETRLSGALTKLKSAMVIKRTTGTNVVVAPVAPTFNEATGALTITNTTGVVYKHGATVLNAAGSPYTVPEDATWVIDATPAAGYYFGTSDDDQWSFTNPA